MSLRKTNSEKYLWWSLLLFTEKIWPLIVRAGLRAQAQDGGEFLFWGKRFGEYEVLCQFKNVNSKILNNFFDVIVYIKAF